MQDKSKPEESSMTELQNVISLAEGLERLNTEQTEIEEKYQHTIEYANDAILTTDSKGAISSFNKKAEMMFGYTREEIIGKPASMLLPVHKRTEETEKFKYMSMNFDSAQTGTLREGLALTKDGQTFHIEGSFHLIKPEGKYAVTGIIRDISNRKRMEEQLRASEERARAILNASPDIVILIDNRGTLIDCNEALRSRFNTSRDDLLGKTVFDMFSMDEAQKRYLFMKTIIAVGRPVHYQDIIRGRWFDLSVHPILDAQGKTSQVVIFAHDITELKQKEEEIALARDKFKALAKEFTTVEENARRNFSNYLHDRIGQTLFVLKIRLEMLANNLKDKQSDDNWTEIFKLMNIVIDETRSLSYEMSPAILNELGLDAALEWLVDQTNKQYDISVSFRTDHTSKTMDKEICNLLYRAAGELLANVIKHAKANYVSVSIRKDANQIQLEIEDDGVGFDTEILNILPDHDKGFGIFSIRERLQWHNGVMIIKSALDQGTHITLLVPLKNPE